MRLLTLPNLWHLLPPRGYWEHQIGKRSRSSNAMMKWWMLLVYEENTQRCNVVFITHLWECDFLIRCNVVFIRHLWECDFLIISLSPMKMTLKDTDISWKIFSVPFLDVATPGSGVQCCSFTPYSSSFQNVSGSRHTVVWVGPGWKCNGEKVKSSGYNRND